MNGQRNRTNTAVLVQWPGHSMDGEHTSSDRYIVLFSWLCVLQSFLFMEDISQWKMGFTVVLHMVCYLCFWSCCHSQKSRQWGARLWKSTGNVWVVTAQVWVFSHESSFQLLPWAFWHWQELKLIWALVFSLFGTTEDEIVCDICYETIVARFVWRPAL